MRRKLSAIEHMIDANIVYVVGVEGYFSSHQLRSALSRVQRKHPALRTMIREDQDGLYYEANDTPEIPLRIVPYQSEEDCLRECQAELYTRFFHGQPQLRIVWLLAEPESILLFTCSHRICDGMSMLTIVREVLRSIHSDEELIPYESISTQDLIGDYQAAQLWKRKLAAHLFNGLVRLIPNSHRAPDNKEHGLEWKADRALSDAIKLRCKMEGVSIHAALLVTLDRALFAAFGKKKLPRWIENHIDPRRGRVGVLKSDVLFFGGGSFKVPSGQSQDVEFWTRAQTVNEEMRRQIEKEILNIPSRFHFAEMLHPITAGKIQTIVRLGDALKMNGSWNHFGFSNLGNIVMNEDNDAFRLRDLRLYVHSFNFRLLGLATYTFHGEMHFYCGGDEKCMSIDQLHALKHEFMSLLQQQAMQPEHAFHEAPVMANAGGQ